MKQRFSMRFRDHSNLAGKHAFLSPSSYHWVNYDEQKMEASIFASFAARRGSDLHDLAQRMITLGVKLPDTTQTLNQYVNDCIGFRMTPEQTLYYSPNCYGHADAIGFGKMKLRVFDLKTGINKTKVTQLEVYAALFCLEYDFKPINIEMEFRIYQNDQVQLFEGDPLEVTRIMDHIVVYDRRIEELRTEAYG
jgi:hypothetical protein